MQVHKRPCQAWIKTTQPGTVARGWLYEAADSSLRLTSVPLKRNLTYIPQVTAEIPIGHIDVIKLRPSGSIELGTIAGCVVGIVSSMFLVNELGVEKEDKITATLLVGTAMLPIFGGAGALIGSMKSSVQVHGNQQSYADNLGVLRKYSPANEPEATLKKSSDAYRYRSFAGYMFGPSFPVGKFASEKTGREYTAFAKSGGGGHFPLVYRIKPTLGIAVLAFDHQFDYSIADSSWWWDVGGITAGPVISFPLPYRFYLDLKPGIGFVNAQLQTNDAELIDNGVGVALSLDAGMSWNFAKRWALLGEMGGLYTKQKYDSGRRAPIALYTLDVGIAFRFR